MSNRIPNDGPLPISCPKCGKDLLFSSFKSTEFNAHKFHLECRPCQIQSQYDINEYELHGSETDILEYIFKELINSLKSYNDEIIVVEELEESGLVEAPIEENSLIAGATF